MHITANIYGNTPITVKALDYIQIDNGIINPPTNGSVTIETGKITSGTDFTSSNTPYSREEYPSCGIEGQIGSSVAPQTLGRTHSNRMDMPTIEELEISNQPTKTRNTNENVVFTYPNPTTDFCQLETREELKKITLLDQNGAPVKEFGPLDRTLDMQEFASGVYTLVVIFTSKPTEYVKIIKL